MFGRADQVDVDAHVIETERTWDYLDPDEAAFRPRLEAPGAGAPQWVLDGAVLGFRPRALDPVALGRRARAAGRRLYTTPAARTLDDVPARLADMDALGVAVQVLHSTLWIAPLPVPARAHIALCRAWNRWVADAAERSGGRLRWCCVLPVQDRDAALELLDFSAAHGAVAMALRPWEGGRALSDPWHDPLYQRACELDLAVAVHIGNGAPALHEALRLGGQRIANFSAYRLPAVGACLDLLLSDVPERWPALRFGFIEASAQWVPWVVNEYHRRAGKRRVADPFVRARAFVAAQSDDDLAWVLRYCDAGQIVAGTDYGHADAAADLDTLARLHRRRGVSRRLAARIRSANPRRLFARLGPAPARWGRRG